MRRACVYPPSYQDTSVGCTSNRTGACRHSNSHSHTYSDGYPDEYSNTTSYGNCCPNQDTSVGYTSNGDTYTGSGTCSHANIDSHTYSDGYLY